MTTNFTCPVCWETYKRDPNARRPFIICENGHAACKRCADQVRECPQDRQALLSTFIENRQLLDALDEMSNAARQVPMIKTDQLHIDDEPIGSGGEADVYYGKWLDQPVAVKVARVDPLDEKMLQTLKEEASTVIGLHHPNIARIFGLATTRRGRPAMVMDRLEYGTLRKLIREQELTLEEKAQVCIDIISAISYLHSKRIVHRDLKPDNILVSVNTSDTSKRYKVVVTDFGISKVLETINVVTTEKNTPRFAAPELLIYGSPYNGSADIFSFGTVMYELFSGQHIFPGGSSLQIMKAISDGNMPSIPESIPEPVRETISKCWSVDPNQRPALEELRTAMLGLLADDEASESCPSSPEIEVVPMQRQASEIAESMLPVPTTELEWNVEESEYCKELRRKMVTDLRGRSNFKDLFHEPLLAAAGCIPRHKFADNNRSTAATDLLKRTEEPSNVASLPLLPSEKRESLLVAYQYSCPMPATEWGNESSPEVLLAQLSLVNLEPGSSVLLIGAKGGYTQAIVSQLVGFHGSVCTVSGNREAMDKCKERCNNVCPPPLNQKLQWSTVSDITNWEEIIRLVENDKRIPDIDAIVVCGSIDCIPHEALSILTTNGRVLAPVNRGNSQVLQVKTKHPRSTRDINDFPVSFGKPV